VREFSKKIFSILATLCLATPLLALEVPFLSGRIVDQAGILSGNSMAQINASLERLETETGAQVAVLTVASLQDEPIETYSLKVVEKWKLGKKGQDNGVLFLIAPKDRRMRIEVGYGLEGVIPDALSNRILDTIVAPQFKQGNFDGGVLLGVDALEKLVRKEPVPELQKKARRAPTGKSAALLIKLIFFILFFVIVAANGRNGRRGGGGGFFYMGSGGGGWSSGGGGGFSGGGGSFGGGGSSSSW